MKTRDNECIQSEDKRAIRKDEGRQVGGRGGQGQTGDNKGGSGN